MSIHLGSLRRRLLASVVLGLAPAAAFGADTTVANGQTSGQIAFGGSDRVTVQAGGTVSTSGQVAITMTSDSTGARIDNAGTVQVIGAAPGIGIPGVPRSGPLTINNTGTISAPGGVGIGLSLATGPVTIFNSGTIAGAAAGNAVVTGSGDDVLNLSTGSSITGKVQLGAGTDTVNLAGSSNAKTATQSFGDVFGAETVNVNSGYWTLNAELGADAVTVANGATLEIDDVNSATGAFISPSGALTLTNNGLTIRNTSDTRMNVDADATYIGGTGSVELKGGGVLQYGANTTLTGLTTVTNGTALVTGNAPGAFSVSSQGVLRIGAAFSSPDVDGYVTIVSGGGTTGMVSGNVANAGQVIFDRANAATYAGVISGGGSVTKSGGGVLTLSGANTYTGPTNVTAGGLAVTGSLAGATVLTAGTTLDVASGGTVRAVFGNGVTITNGGMIATPLLTTGTASTITLGNTASVLSNSGLIRSFNGHAVTFGTGNDVLNLSTGSLIAGVVQMGAGTDTVNLAGGVGVKTLTQTFGAILGAETVNVNSGYWTLNADLETDAFNVANGATLEVDQTANGNEALVTPSGSFLTIVNNGKVTMNTGNTRTDGDTGYLHMSGSGEAELKGGGVQLYGPYVSLTGLTTVTDGTMIVTGTAPGPFSVASQGVLRIGAAFSGLGPDGYAVILTGGGATGMVSNNIANAGKVIFDRSNAATYAGVISGAGSVTKTGSGALTLTGANTYTGVTTVAGGSLILDTSLSGATVVNPGATLQIGEGGASGGLGGSLVDNGTVIFNRSDDYTLVGAFSGRGSLIKRGAGKLTLDGFYAFSGATSIEGGTIKITQLDASGPLVMAPGSIVDLSGAAQTIGGLAGGAGSTIDIDGGSLTVNNTSGTSNVYSGVLTGAGALTVTGSGVTDLAGANTYTGPTTVNGGTLKVNGSIASNTTVNAGGVLGGSGRILGSVTVSQGAVLSPGNSPGTLTIAGPLTLAAGSTTAIEVDPTLAPDHDQIVVGGAVTIAAGAKLQIRPLGAIGNYGRTQTYTILTAGGGVTGAFAAGDVSSTMPLLTPSLTYTANAVNLRLVRNDITFASLSVTANQRAVAAAAEASGSGTAAYEALVAQDAAGARAGFDALSGEIYGSIGSLLLTQGAGSRDAMLSQAREGVRGAFLQVTGENTDLGATANAGHARGRGYGLIGGGQVKGGAFTLGFTLGYGRSDIEVAARASSAKVDRFHGGLYGAGQVGPVRLGGGVDHGQAGVKSGRTIEFPTVSQHVSARYDVTTTDVFGEVAYPAKLGGLALEPFASASHTWLTSDAFRETGGALALSVGEQSRGVTTTRLGLRLDGELSAGRQTTVYPRLSVSWQHAAGDIRGRSSAAFGTSAFEVAGVGAPEDAAAIEAGLGVALSSKAKAWLSYEGMASRAGQSQGLKAGVAFVF